MATAKNKIIKLLRKHLSFERVEEVLNERGYSVVFFNTPSGDMEIERYGLETEKDTLMAFTYSETARIVFIDGTLSAEDKLYSALHELGHIILGHLKSDIFNRNKVLMDIEADNFAYTVIRGEKKGALYILASAAMLSFSLIFSTAFLNKDSAEAAETYHLTDVQAYTQPDIETNVETDIKTEIVYVTPSGTKFHRKDCMYTKNKTLTELLRSKASTEYAPCKVCKP